MPKLPSKPKICAESSPSSPEPERCAKPIPMRKSSLLVFAILSIFGGVVLAVAEPPEFKFETETWQGSYTEKDLSKSWFATTADGLQFRAIYLDGACQETKYLFSIVDNQLQLERQDIPESCSLNRRPFVVKGEIKPLAPGVYQFRIVRKNALGKPMIVFEKEIIVGGKW